MTKEIKYIEDSKIVSSFTYSVIKRLIDLIGSVLILIFLSPFILIISIIIFVTSGRPILYNWNVLGKNGSPFKSWKFRSMVVDADSMKEKLSKDNEMIGPVFKIKNDPRITKFGKFLRKYSLDEVVQLLSVIKGDMSLVGPRPAGPLEFENYEDWQKRRLSVMPGITGPWQVSGRNEINNFTDWVEIDLEYIDNWSLARDFIILLKTIPAALKGTGM